MEPYKNTGIKEIITEFPRVGEILGEYGIGCVSCTVGICQLKDVVDIHTLAPEKEKELMLRIEAAINPDLNAEVIAAPETAKREEVEHIFSSPMQILVDEHVLIKRWLALIPVLLENVDLTDKEGRQIFLDGLDLIRSYADRLHHGKEEDILFKYFDDSEKIFQVIYEDHRIARNHVKEMHTAIEKVDMVSLHHHLNAYRDLLAEHIEKEDEILFPWLDRKLSATQIAELASKFDEKDSKIDVEPEQYRAFVDRLEKKYAKN